jgi:hypothetical protein
MPAKAAAQRRWGRIVVFPCPIGCAVSGKATFRRLDIIESFCQSLLGCFQRLPNGLNGRSDGKALLQMLDLIFS